MKVLTVDRLLELVNVAKKQIGGDKPIVLTNHDGTVLVCLDDGRPPEEENAWSHLPAHRQKDSFGFSTFASVVKLKAKPLTLAQIEGREKIPSILEEMSNPENRIEE